MAIRRRKGFHPVKRRGALTAKAKRAKMSVRAFARKNYHAKGRLGKEARFAVIARKWNHGGGRRKARGGRRIRRRIRR